MWSGSFASQDGTARGDRGCGVRGWITGEDHHADGLRLVELPPSQRERAGDPDETARGDGSSAAPPSPYA